MNDEEEDGPFGSIHEECRISASQESYLQNCPFAFESDVFSDDSDEDITSWTNTHTQLDRMIMVSSSQRPKDNVVFQTPPEGSIADSPQEKEAAAPFDSIPRRRIEGGDGFVDSVVEENDDEYAEAVNLVRESDTLGFTSVKLPQISNNISIDPGTKPLEIETIIIKENVNLQEEEEEVLYVDSPKTVRKTSGSLLCEDDRGEGTSSNKMFADDFETFNYVSSSVVSRKRKELCPVASNGDVRQDTDAPVNRNEISKAPLEALQMVSGKTNDGASEEVDLLETAGTRGNPFSRPKWWWPPEGSDD